MIPMTCSSLCLIYVVVVHSYVTVPEHTFVANPLQLSYNTHQEGNFLK